MKEPARLQTTIDLLVEAAGPRPADALLAAYFRARRYIGAKDRAAIVARFYGTLRHLARLCWWLRHMEYEESGHAGLADMNMPRARALLLVYLRLAENLEARKIIALFDGSEHGPKSLSRAEKKLLGHLDGRTLIHPDMDRASRLEIPGWAFDRLAAALGGNLETEMRAMLEEAAPDIRVNPLKATRADVLEALREEGIAASPTPLSPLGLRISGRPPLASLEIFKNGLIEIQDEGSQLVALLVDAQPGMSVVDFCAGAGGKTLAMAACMNNRGRVIACDVLGGRLKRARARFRRAGLHNVEIRELSSENDGWVKRNAGRHDRVLVDAPCSGTGVWRRNPDARWKQMGPELEELLALQARILASAARLVRPGGRLIYATCSLLEEENERQVEKFLEAQGKFSRTPVQTIFPLPLPACAKAPAGPWGKLVRRSSQSGGGREGIKGWDFAEGSKGSMGSTKKTPMTLAPLETLLDTPSPTLSLRGGESGGAFGESLSPCLKLTPARHGADGFFAAVMERRAA